MTPSSVRTLLPLLLGFIVCTIVTTGCNRGPRMVHVSGQVLMKDGSLLPRGVRVIRFEPAQDTPAAMRRTAIAQIQDDGSFEMFTHKPGDGVLPGKYAVIISVLKAPRDPVLLIAKKYTMSATTPYHETVEHDMEGLVYHVEPIK